MKNSRRRREESLFRDPVEKAETRHLVPYVHQPSFPLASGTAAHTLRAPMAWRRKITGGVLGVIGFLLSPLSWWNDAVVNLPLALLFAWVLGLIYKPASLPRSPAFDVAVIVGYWLTNVLGFVLMHKGAHQMFSKEEKKYSRREWLKDLVMSLLYTALIVVLLKVGILKPITAYFK
jgi:hypothetical protein